VRSLKVALMSLPVYLDQKVQVTLAAPASAKRVEFSALINDKLKKDMELMQIVHNTTATGQKHKPHGSRALAAGGCRGLFLMNLS
jgi:hypothetical protein